MSVTKLKPMPTMLAAAFVFGCGILTYRVVAVEPAQEGGKAAPVANSDAFTRLQLEMTQRELIQVQSDLRKTRLDVKFWTPREAIIAKMHIPNSAVEERVSQDPAVNRYLTRLAELRDQLAQAIAVAKDPKDSPEVKDFQTQIAATEKTIEGLRKALEPQIVARAREKAIDEFKGRLVQLGEQIEFSQELEKVLRAEVQRLTDELDKKK
jgi:hypothetical protein